MSTSVPLAPADASPAMRFVTLGAPLLLAALAFVPDPDEGPPPHWPLLALSLLLGLGFWLAPRRLAYSLTGDGLVIRRLLGQDLLPYAGLRARHTAGRLGIRTFGTGMPGYLTGHFTFGPDPVRSVRAAAIRTGGGVLLESAGRAHFLTPADPDAFLAALARHGARVERGAA